MKISLNQLKSYVEINVPVEELCDRMVMAGFEVESIESQGDKLVNVVVARIEKITPHENSDHLQICQMNIGGENLVQIVTGAQNIKEGDLVPAALDNSILPNGMNIKAGKDTKVVFGAKKQAELVVNKGTTMTITGIRYDGTYATPRNKGMRPRVIVDIEI